jgi:hypothetical protein
VDSSAPVRQLLPHDSAALFVVVSRRRLDGLLVNEGARPVQLGVLDRTDSVAMVRADLTGHPVGPIEDAVVEAVATLCDDWPMAIRIALARLVSVHSGSVEHLATDLSDPKTRLSRLDLPDVGASLPDLLDESFAALPARATVVYRALAVTESEGFGPADIARLASLEDGVAERVIEDLVAASLVIRVAARRYRVQELVRLHAGSLP